MLFVLSDPNATWLVGSFATAIDPRGIWSSALSEENEIAAIARMENMGPSQYPHYRGRVRRLEFPHEFANEKEG
jgi:hypothetical protein